MKNSKSSVNHDCEPSISVSNPFYTIGHSTLSLDDFMALLCHYGVTLVADVRAFPYSRRNRDYDGTNLQPELAACGIGYSHFPALGGRRPRSKTVPVNTNAFWRVQSFHNYADYALGEDFHHGLTQLIEAGKHAVVAIMCAEVLWWRCHRRIITDYLLANGIKVFHILSMSHVVPAGLTEAAVVADNHCITYPQDESAQNPM
ncbi:MULTISPECIES: DUF488 domain-containing protein [Acetobacter]|jgi:uncharacterized protein (DUF488 family)|uniref:Uncharacterized protein (DUF488 family) n=1 Tax=Acetobacter lovaniensis TaxID=104100 RepID=A0A841QGU3_9PROT|nr:DUF488 domain-containing protein [Acetobacter lovaniensis]MBB6457740.1 uncharacterized protein (DUF488 family) [Acetobacter lovaniensis]MCI1698613.1 DUF488 domain-containing protein [Acetobacter lovaniensis]MCP1239919.1 DUF488 domain-containing protein [Acetobacter lovaniensis]NHN82019.1 DUF488 family protein [Acetobacter lovaniensis]GBQ71895.1 hypothetical protein AA0474_2571 [Acetobacter lovaniensis NRIC 0474]